jgi:hypothetical protein
MSRLGFTVAPDAAHPFGTENCCVFLPDGTYLEPLGIAQRETCERQAIRGNVFVGRDQAYRFRHGDDGFSAVVFATDDAEKVHKSLRKNGMSAGKMLRFKRVFESPAGEKAEAEFANAFAGDLRAPDMFAFACQRVKWPEMDRSKLTRHANGVKSLREVVLSEVNPTDFQYFLQEIINQRDQFAHSFGLDLNAANATISVLNSDGMRAWFGTDDTDEPERGLKCRGLVLGVRNIDKLRALFEKNGVSFRDIGNRVVVDPEAGQGLILAFEAEK